MHVSSTLKKYIVAKKKKEEKYKKKNEKEKRNRPLPPKFTAGYFLSCRNVYMTVVIIKKIIFSY